MNSKKVKSGIWVIISLIIVMIGYFFMQPDFEELSPATANVSGKLQVHFIDVGQADCTLIENNGEFMLVDAGNNGDGKLVVNYLKEQGVTKLKYAIGTHPHEDHIGGMDDVINNFDIETIIMPSKTTNTKTFEDVLKAIDAKKMSITKPAVGTTYTLGLGEFTILSPNKGYGDNLNNYSVGIRFVYGKNSLVMCGDAETTAEKDIINNGLELKSDVLKLGHHGSSSSSSDVFLDAVNPTYAVILCETGNSYGHPHAETIQKMKDRGIKVFRTDTQGTVIMESDGTNITWNQSPAQL